MIAASAALFTAASAMAGLNTPNWDYVPDHVDACVDASQASSPSNPDNVRWVTYALPTGTAPAGGWPIYIDLVTDNYPVTNKTCGPGAGHVRKTYEAFATPRDVMAPCFPPSSSQPVLDACADAMASSCASAAKSGLMACAECARNGPVKAGSCSEMEGFSWCREHAGGGGHGSECGYDQEAGAMWDHRLKQYLVANGIAVFNVNPISEDSWDAFQMAWDGYNDHGEQTGGVDKPFLQTLFKNIKSGNYGHLDLSKTVIRGWSSGAQMVSWLVQVMATDPTVFPDVTMAGGVMLSGGSYQCYNDNQGDPPIAPIGSCADCTEGGASHCEGDPLCSSCDPTTKTYCGQCCPRNYTEQYFEDHPDQWHTHPPMFLAQTSTEDNHADLCACKHYHDTLIQHNVMSVLQLVPEEDESCFCVGNPSNPAAAGAPFASKCSEPSWGKDCSTMGGPNCCISHTFGFANMIEPAVGFVLNVTKGMQRR